MTAYLQIGEPLAKLFSDEHVVPGQVQTGLGRPQRAGRCNDREDRAVIRLNQHDRTKPTHMKTQRQTDRHIDRQTDTHTLTNRQTDTDTHHGKLRRWGMTLTLSTESATSAVCRHISTLCLALPSADPTLAIPPPPSRSPCRFTQPLPSVTPPPFTHRC